MNNLEKDYNNRAFRSCLGKDITFISVPSFYLCYDLVAYHVLLKEWTLFYL